MEVGLGDDDGARVLQLADDISVLRRHVAREAQGAAGGRHAGGIDVVLEQDRNAVQRADRPRRLELRIQVIGDLQRFGIDQDNGVQGWTALIIGIDARQIHFGQPAGSQPALPHRGMDVLDGRLDQVELDRPGGGTFGLVHVVFRSRVHECPFLISRSIKV